MPRHCLVHYGLREAQGCAVPVYVLRWSQKVRLATILRL